MVDNLCVCSSEEESKENCACVSPFLQKEARKRHSCRNEIAFLQGSE